MLIKDNKQHVAAFTSILAACSSVRSYDVKATSYNLTTFHNNGFAHDNMTQALALIWSEHKGTLLIPLAGKYYAKIKLAIYGKYAAYELIFVSQDKRCNTCGVNEIYNATGGYWYTSEYDINKTAKAALQSARFVSLRAIVSAFNRALYLR